MTDPIKAKIIELCPDLLELKFGCEIQKVFWYKTEKDKKEGNVDWMQTGHHPDGKRGTIVKDLRHPDYLPMWVDYGDQLEFQIEPDDIVSFEILGSPITLCVVLRAIRVKTGLEIVGNGTSDPEDSTHILINNEAVWDLTKDYDQQSEECKQFIGSLLSV